MTDSTQRASLFSSATVVAAIISGLTAVVTALLPWLLGAHTNSETGAVAPTPVHAVTPLYLPPSVMLQPVERATPKPDLTMGVWTINNATDEAGTNWEGSLLKFTAQEEASDGLALTGFFEWREDDTVVGREHFVAQFDPHSRQVFIVGQSAENSSRILAIGSYSAQLSDDGRQLLKGTWGNTPGNLRGIPGGWEARR